MLNSCWRYSNVHLLYNFTLTASPTSWLVGMFNIWTSLLCRFVWTGCCVGSYKQLVSELYFTLLLRSTLLRQYVTFCCLKMKKCCQVGHWLWTLWNGQLEVSSALLLMIWHWLIVVVDDICAVVILMYIVTSVILNLWQMLCIHYYNMILSLLFVIAV